MMTTFEQELADSPTPVSIDYKAGAAAVWDVDDNAVRLAFGNGREPVPFASIPPSLAERYMQVAKVCIDAALECSHIPAPSSNEETFKGAIDTDSQLQAAAREAGWALTTLVDISDWQRRDQLSEIIGRLAAALIDADTPSPVSTIRVPDGYALVPIEPTEVMKVAGCGFDDPLGGLVDWKGGDTTTRETVSGVYSAMLAAAFTEGSTACLTCDDTGKEGRHSICRDCDETPSTGLNMHPVAWGHQDDFASPIGDMETFTLWDRQNGEWNVALYRSTPALTSEEGKCPICSVTFKPEDICADDVTEGTCHAECLEGSPVVDFDTGGELPGGKIDTYPYRDIMDPSPEPRGGDQ